MSAAITTAATAAAYVIQNAGKYSNAVVTSARNAIAAGTGTTIGIAAALEFLGGLMAALTIPEWLLLLAGVGGSAAAIYLAFVCLAGGYS